MKIIITGGLGQLGSRLENYLTKIGHDIYVSTSKELNENQKKKNLFKIKAGEKKSKIIKLLNGFECIIHSAGLNSDECQNNPKLAYKINKDFTSEILECAISAGVKTFIYFSTAHVYKSPLNGYFDESTIAQNNHPYADSKRNAEELIIKAHNENKINSIILRLSNCFGYPVGNKLINEKLFINDIINQALKTNTIKLKSPSSTIRDFVTISSLEKTVQIILANDIKLNNPILNFGSGSSKSILEVAKLIKKRCKDIYNLNIKIEELNKDKFNSEKLIYSIKKLIDHDLYFESNFTKEIDNIIRFVKINEIK